MVSTCKLDVCVIFQCVCVCVCVHTSICLLVFFHEGFASVFRSLSCTRTLTHKHRGLRRGEMVGDEREGRAVKRELWILKDFPLLQEWMY